MKSKMLVLLATTLVSLSALAAVGSNACCAKSAGCCPGKCCPTQSSCACCNHK